MAMQKDNQGTTDSSFKDTVGGVNYSFVLSIHQISECVQKIIKGKII